MNDIKKIFKRLFAIERRIKQIKRKSKALDKIILLCKKYDLKLTRNKGGILIIKGLFDFGGDE